MTFNRYYQDELTYLRELGAEFAKQNPELAPYLSGESRDPDVERLVEAFAFLTGRLREKLDDGLPEVVHSLLGLLWPQALQPIPCTTVLRFDPMKGVSTGSEAIRRGTQILSKPIEGTSCVFRTCYDVRLQPFSVTTAELGETAGRSIIRIGISPLGDVNSELTDLSSLRFFLNFDREAGAGAELRLLLLRHVRRIQVITASGTTVSLPHASFAGVGFSEDEAVLDAVDNGFGPYRLVQEFLNLPRKFAFVTLNGLPAMASFMAAPFVIVVELDRQIHGITRISPEQICLNCTPALNLFETDAQAISLTRRLTEYRLLPADPERMRIADVLTVTAWQRGRSERVTYDKFEVFDRHKGAASAGCFKVRLRPGVTRRHFEHYISFADRHERPIDVPAELAVARITCSNGTLPELLGIGDINRPSNTSPVSATFRNVTSVSPFIRPPVDDMRLWALVSIMARNYYPISHPEGLRSLLGHLNFRSFQDRGAARQQEMFANALQAVRTEHINVLVRGHPLRARHITLDVDEDGMEGLGRAHLFGEVMEEFLRVFASVNTCHKLTLHGTRSNARYDWPARAGATQPI